MSIKIEGLDKAAVLAALYNASRQQGMGFMHARGASGMTIEEARKELEGTTYFDYLHGRVMKIDLSGDDMDEWLYDRDNGQGAAYAALKPLLKP
jgi:hypothetical protein